MSWLADTNVVSELSRRSPNRGVLNWFGRVGHLTVSAVTVEEIYFGLAWHPNPGVRNWCDRFFASSATVLPITEDISRQAGLLRGSLQAKGMTRIPADILIAVTASVHRMTLVTRNTAHFRECGISLLNPFS